VEKGALKERVFQERGLLVPAGRGWQYSYKKIHIYTNIYIHTRNEICKSHSQSTLLRKNKRLEI